MAKATTVHSVGTVQYCLRLPIKPHAPQEIDMASFESIMKKFLESYEKLPEDELVKEFMVRGECACSNLSVLELRKSCCSWD